MSCINKNWHCTLYKLRRIVQKIKLQKGKLNNGSLIITVLNLVYITIVGLALTVYSKCKLKWIYHCSNSHAKCVANSARNKPQYCSWPQF